MVSVESLTIKVKGREGPGMARGVVASVVVCKVRMGEGSTSQSSMGVNGVIVSVL